MSIEIEFPLDRARSTMEPSQIERSLFEDSGRQIFPARFELVIVGNVHVVVIGFVISFSSFRRFRFQRISKNRRTADDADETDESNPNSRMINRAEDFFLHRR